MIELETKQTAGATQVSDAVAELVDALKAHPAYSALRATHEALQADEEAQQLIEDLQARQRRLQFSTSETDEAEFQERLDRFYRLPTVAAYHEAEDAFTELLKEVDGVISATAGIDFAANAKRSCCGG